MATPTDPTPPRPIEAAERRAILDAYPDRGVLRRLYRRLRLSRAGYAELEAQVPAHGRVVDLGAGEGLLGHLLARRAPGRHVVAVDHDAARSAALADSARGLALEAVCDSLLSYPLASCSAVLLVDVLHYFDEPTQEGVLHRAHAALSGGGTLVMRDPDAGAGGRFLWNRLHERTFTLLGITKGHIGTYRPVAAWVALLARLGFPEVYALPGPRFALYADRTVVARCPPSPPSSAAT